MSELLSSRKSAGKDVDGFNAENRMVSLHPAASAALNNTHTLRCYFLDIMAVQLFFAKVLRSAAEGEVKALFAPYGRVYDVNLFRAFQGAPTTKVSAYSSNSATGPALGNGHATKV